MVEILHDTLPPDMIKARPLPGVEPVRGPWLRFDEAYAGQMARRRELLAHHRKDVVWQASDTQDASVELLELVLSLLAQEGFALGQQDLLCPDGTWQPIDREDPLGTLGRLVQCDFCLLEKEGDEHLLKGAVLCFPASWRLDEKAGRPLVDIHAPVDVYTENIARRVQRLFDGVRPGLPIWRFNRLWYSDAELFQPRSMHARRPGVAQGAKNSYFRAERQTILRLPKSNWVVFAIHTYVLKAKDVPL